MMDLDRVNAYMARVEESETKTFQPVGSKLKVGLDLGTAYIVMVVLDEENNPIACEKQAAQVLRDGVVVDYSGALRIVVVRDGVPAYAAGEEQPGDSRLAQAADGVGEAEVLVSAGERSIYRTSGEYQGGTWALYLFGTSQGQAGGAPGHGADELRHRDACGHRVQRQDPPVCGRGGRIRGHERPG